MLGIESSIFKGGIFITKVQILNSELEVCYMYMFQIKQDNELVLRFMATDITGHFTMCKLEQVVDYDNHVVASTAWFERGISGTDISLNKWTLFPHITSSN